MSKIAKVGDEIELIKDFSPLVNSTLPKEGERSIVLRVRENCDIEASFSGNTWILDLSFYKIIPDINFKIVKKNESKSKQTK